MLARPDRRQRRSWLFTALAFIAFAAQLVVALAPLGEEPVRRMSSHIESGSSKAHYSHDDAKCASCQARSIHGSTAKPDVPFFVDAPVVASFIAVVDRVVAGELSPQTNPRAPPTHSMI